MCCAKSHVRFTPESGHVRCKMKCPLCAKSGHPKLGVALSRISDKYRRARQSDDDFGELPRLRIDLYRPAMLLDDDVVTDGEAKPGAFSRWFCREERIEYFLFHFGWNAGAVVADSDFDAIPKTFGCGRKGWLIAIATDLPLVLGRRVEAI